MALKKTIFNFDVFNRWLTLFTNIGVIIGLVLVFYEVHQNTLALDNSSDIAVWSIGTQSAGLVIESAEVAELLTRFQTEPWDNFNSVEQMRLNVLLGVLLDRFELQRNLYDSRGEELKRDDVLFPEFLVKLDTFKTWWKYQKENDGGITAPFIEYFDAYIKEVNGGR